MQEKQDFERVIEQLREARVPDAVLYKLSNLHGLELSRLAEAWPTLSGECRQGIITRLAEIGEADFETDFSEVFKICLTDTSPQVRAAAVDGLWEVEDVILIRPLVRMLQRDESALVREAAAISLSRYALMAELGRLGTRLSNLIWKALWDTFHDLKEDVTVRRRAVEALAYFDRPQVSQIIELAYQDEEEMMRISAVFAMGRSADDKWSGQVLDELEREDPAMRYEAARAAGELLIAEAVPLLARMVADPDLEVRLVAAWALGQIGGPEAQRVLEICLQEGDEALQEAAEEALDQMDFMEGSLDFPLYELDEDEEDGDWEDEDDLA